MNKKVLALIAACLFATPMLAGAVPIQYDLTYSATTGPNGVGSFVFDHDNGAMSGFVWDFGGVLGGTPDLNFNLPRPPGFPTAGQMLFETITGIDTTALYNCSLGCSYTSINAFRTFTIRNTVSAVSYELQQGTLYSTGLVTLAPRSVPEPATFGLFVLGMLTAGVARRRHGARLNI